MEKENRTNFCTRTISACATERANRGTSVEKTASRIPLPSRVRFVADYPTVRSRSPSSALFLVVTERLELFPFRNPAGLISRDLAEALLSVESRFVPTLGWLVALGTHVGLREETGLIVA